MSTTTTPNTTFWSDLPSNIHAQLLEHTTEPLLTTSLSSLPGPRTTPEEELSLLETYIQSQISALKSTPPTPILSLETLLHARGLIQWTSRRNVPSAESTWREMISLRPAGDPNLAACMNLAAVFLEDEKRLDEAEVIFRLLVPLLQPDKEGRATPQGLGAIRGLAEVAVKKGEMGRAGELLDEAQRGVDGLDEGELKREEQEAIDELRMQLK